MKTELKLSKFKNFPLEFNEERMIKANPEMMIRGVAIGYSTGRLNILSPRKK